MANYASDGWWLFQHIASGVYRWYPKHYVNHPQYKYDWRLISDGNVVNDTVATNLATNPSFETATTGTSVVRRNLCTNPGIEVNTAGWIAAGPATLSRATTERHSGSASLQVTTPGVGPNEGAIYTVSGIASSEPHSGGVWVKAPVGARLYCAIRMVASDTTYQEKQTLFVGTGDWQFVKAEGMAHTNAATAYVMVRTIAGYPPQALVYWVDDAIIEKSSTLGDYFDGSTPDALGIDYGWEGAVNASASVAKASTVVVRTNRKSNPVPASATGYTVANNATLTYGSNAITVACVVGNTDSGINIGAPAVAAGETITYSMEVEGVVAGNWRWNIQGATGGVAGPDIAIAVGEVKRVSITFTHTAAGSPYVYFLRRNPNGTETIKIRKVLIEQSPVAGTYFDGSTGAAGDFSYGWTGTPNASTSVQRGVGVARVGAGFPERAARIQSTEWAKSGTKSIRVIPFTDVSYAEVSVVGLTVGQAYTLICTVRRVVPGVGTAHPSARKFAVVVGSPEPPVTMITTPPNEAGEYEMRGVFVATNSGHGIRIMNGYSVGDCWFDDFAVVPCASIAEPYTGPYFDGSTYPDQLPDPRMQARWVGAPNASASEVGYYAGSSYPDIERYPY